MVTNATHLARLKRPMSYADPTDKGLFHSTGRTLLKRLAQELDHIYGQWEVRSNKGGIAVSGEITLHMDKLYVQVSQSALGSDNYVLYRSCNGRKDYTGGPNNFASAEQLVDTHGLAELIKRRIKV